MKIEIDNSRLIDEIVEKVVNRLKPLISNTYNQKDDDFMDVKGLVEYLNVKESWIYHKVHTRQIPFQKVGRHLRFRKKKIIKWMEGQEFEEEQR